MLKNSRKTTGHTQTAATKAIKILKIQFFAVLVIALLVSVFNLVNGYSILLGGCIYLVPSLYTTNKILVKNSTTSMDKSANQTLAELYMSQIWKMVISAMLFALVFVLVKPLSPFSLFGAFIAIQVLGGYLQVKTKNKFIKL